jgi:hypothetical protein
VTDPAISFVVPVRNDAHRLRRCLQTIREGTPSWIGVEVVVADNGSTDGSIEVARAAGATVLSLPDVRLGELRNRAAGATRAPVLAFVDADHEIGPAWNACALESLRQPRVAGVGAPYHAPAPGTWVQRLYDRLRRHPTSREEVAWLGSGNIAMRRDVFMAVNGFDTTLETCEDVDLCRKLRARGDVLVADRRMRCVHHGDPATLGQVFLGELWRGRDNIRVSLRRPLVSRTLVSAAMPVATLVAIGLFLVGLVTAPLGGLTLTALAAGYLLLLVGVRASTMTGDAQVTDWPRACAVAAAYELGRALAVVGRFGYRRRRRAAVA